MAKLSAALITFLGQHTGGCIETNSQTTYVNWCLMQGQTKKICSQRLLRSPVYHPFSVWASLIILSCPIIFVCGLCDPGHSAICSDSIDAEIRGAGQEGTGTHMFADRSGDASLESLSPQAALLDQTVERR